MSTFAQTLKSLREERGLSRAAFAKAAGVSQMTVFNAEAKGRMPRPATMTQLAQALGIDVSELSGPTKAAPSARSKRATNGRRTAGAVKQPAVAPKARRAAAKAADSAAIYQAAEVSAPQPSVAEILRAATEALVRATGVRADRLRLDLRIES